MYFILCFIVFDLDENCYPCGYPCNSKTDGVARVARTPKRTQPFSSVRKTKVRFCGGKSAKIHHVHLANLNDNFLSFKI